MENLNEEKKEKAVQPKKNTYKGKIVIILVLVLVAISVYGYYWYRSTQKMRIEAQSVIDRANKYEVLSKELEKESNRCKNFIAQQEGDFGSFEYCKKFIEWSGQK